MPKICIAIIACNKRHCISSMSGFKNKMVVQIPYSLCWWLSLPMLIFKGFVNQASCWSQQSLFTSFTPIVYPLLSGSRHISLEQTPCDLHHVPEWNIFFLWQPPLASNSFRSLSTACIFTACMWIVLLKLVRLQTNISLVRMGVRDCRYPVTNF